MIIKKLTTMARNIRVALLTSQLEQARLKGQQQGNFAQFKDNGHKFVFCFRCVQFFPLPQEVLQPKIINIHKTKKKYSPSSSRKKNTKQKQFNSVLSVYRHLYSDI